MIQELRGLNSSIRLLHRMAPMSFLRNKTDQMVHGGGVVTRLSVRKIELNGRKVAKAGTLTSVFMVMVNQDVLQRQYGFIQKLAVTEHQKQR